MSAAAPRAPADHLLEHERIRRIQFADFLALTAGLPHRIARPGAAAAHVQLAVERRDLEDVQVRRADLYEAGMRRPRVGDFEQRSVSCQVRRRCHEQALLPHDQRAKAHRAHAAVGEVDDHAGQFQRLPMHAVVAAQDPGWVALEQFRQVLVGAQAGGVQRMPALGVGVLDHAAKADVAGDPLARLLRVSLAVGGAIDHPPRGRRGRVLPDLGAKIHVVGVCRAVHVLLRVGQVVVEVLVVVLGRLVFDTQHVASGSHVQLVFEPPHRPRV